MSKDNKLLVDYGVLDVIFILFSAVTEIISFADLNNHLPKAILSTLPRLSLLFSRLITYGPSSLGR